MQAVSGDNGSRLFRSPVFAVRSYRFCPAPPAAYAYSRLASAASGRETTTAEGWSAMVDNEPDSTVEFGEIDRAWQTASLTPPESTEARDVAGAIEETDAGK